MGMLHTAMMASHFVMIAGMTSAAVVASGGAAAAAVGPAFGAAAAPPLQASGVDLVVGGLDAVWTMTSSIVDAPEALSAVWGSAQNGSFWDLNYEWGSMSHGGDVVHGAAAPGHGGVASLGHGAHESGSGLHYYFGEHSAAHVGADSCSVESMLEWEAGEPDLAFIDEQIANGSLGDDGSRAKHFAQFCHDH